MTWEKLFGIFYLAYLKQDKGCERLWDPSTKGFVLGDAASGYGLSSPRIILEKGVWEMLQLLQVTRK